MPVAIFGINSDLTPKYSVSARRTLSQQLYGRPSGKLEGLSLKYFAAFSCSSSMVGMLISLPQTSSLLIKGYNI